MMHLHAGSIINATNALEDSNFENATILLTEANENGCVGFIVNKIFERKLNELVEYKTSEPCDLYNGGPVDQEHLFFIHQRPDLVTGGKLISNHLFMGGDFKQAVTCINNHALSTNDIRIFVGYCGWDAGELEAEINEGSWTMEDLPFNFK